MKFTFYANHNLKTNVRILTNTTLKNGLPEEMVEESAARKRIESGGAAFVPISLKASRILTTQSTYKAIVVAARNARSTGTM